MLKYECDICHEIQEPADTYGPGVHSLGGRPYTWLTASSTSGLTVMPDMVDHVCGSCLGDLLLTLVTEIWPKKWQATFGLGNDEDDDPLCMCGHKKKFHTGTDGMPTSCQFDMSPVKTYKSYDTCMEFMEVTIEDDTGDNRADSNVPEMRAEPEVSEPSPDDSSSLCTCYWEGESFIERLGCPIHSFRRSPR